jgi:type I restriction enzyme, S subunit
MRFPAYPKYKASGVEWLGDLPADWTTRRIKHTTYVKGRIGWQGLRFEEFTEEGPYLVTGTDFREGKVDWMACYHFPEERYEEDPFIQLREGDLLITKDGTIGKVAIVRDMPGPSSLNSGVFVTRALKQVYTNEYMYWVLSSDAFNGFIETQKSGTTIAHLYQNVFVDFSYPVPTLNEQRAITKYLDRETAKIDLLVVKKQTLIERLTEKRAALILRTVTRGLPPDVARTSGLEPHPKLKASGIDWLGNIPEHWKVSRLSYRFRNLDHRREPVSGEDRAGLEKIYPYYGASGIIDHVDEYIFDESLILVAEDGANLLSRSTPLAFLASGRYWVNNHAHILKPIDGDIRYWVAVLQTYDYRPLITGAAQPKLTSERLGGIGLPQPPDSEQRTLADFLDRETATIDGMIAKVETAIERLQEYRAALITAAVTGKIDVRAQQGA